MARAYGGQAAQSGSLFDEAEEQAAAAAAPLAVRMRPRTLDEVVGQGHLTGEGTPFRKLTDNDAPMSLVLWGPPGTGKTTLAYVVSQVTRRRRKTVFTRGAVLTRGATPRTPRMRSAPRGGTSPAHRPLTQAFGLGSLGR